MILLKYKSSHNNIAGSSLKAQTKTSYLFEEAIIVIQHRSKVCNDDFAITTSQSTTDAELLEQTLLKTNLGLPWRFVAAEQACVLCQHSWAKMQNFLEPCSCFIFGFEGALTLYTSKEAKVSGLLSESTFLITKESSSTRPPPTCGATDVEMSLCKKIMKEQCTLLRYGQAFSTAFPGATSQNFMQERFSELSNLTADEISRI